MRHNFHGISGLQISLAGSRNAGELPGWNESPDKRIGHPFGNFMAQWQNVRPARRKNVRVRPRSKYIGLDLLVAVAIRRWGRPVVAKNAADVQAVLVEKC